MNPKHAALQDLLNLTPEEKKHAPQSLDYCGHIELLTQGRRVSVVGSRKVSVDGVKRTEIITQALVRKGITVVSGLAEGVDTIAHQTAIRERGKTIAVLGTPLSQVYPKSNEVLLNTIMDEHLAISQFPEGHPIRKQNFPLRNRTMALISDATIIVEASENSGTRHQGWEALRIGRHLLIMENVANSSAVTWAKEMENYGAQILTRNNMEEMLDEIPFLTSSELVSF